MRRKKKQKEIKKRTWSRRKIKRNKKLNRKKVIGRKRWQGLYCSPFYIYHYYYSSPPFLLYLHLPSFSSSCTRLSLSHLHSSLPYLSITLFSPLFFLLSSFSLYSTSLHLSTTTTSFITLSFSFFYDLNFLLHFHLFLILHPSFHPPISILFFFPSYSTLTAFILHFSIPNPLNHLHN